MARGFVWTYNSFSPPPRCATFWSHLLLHICRSVLHSLLRLVRFCTRANCVGLFLVFFSFLSLTYSDTSFKMRLSTVLLFSSQLLAATALPISGSSSTSVVSTTELSKRVPAEGAAAKPEEAPKKEAAAGEEGGAAGGEGGGGEKANEKEIEGAFNVPVRLGGASVKQDVLFPPGVSTNFSSNSPGDADCGLSSRKTDALKSSSKTPSAAPSP